MELILDLREDLISLMRMFSCRRSSKLEERKERILKSLKDMGLPVLR